MNVTLHPLLQERLEHLAEQDGITPSELADRVLARFFDSMESEAAELREAEEEADRDGWLTTEEVMERVNSTLRKTA